MGHLEKQLEAVMRQQVKFLASRVIGREEFDLFCAASAMIIYSAVSFARSSFSVSRKLPH
jgi:hypothetical protein